MENEACISSKKKKRDQKLRSIRILLHVERKNCTRLGTNKALFWYLENN